jgi:hypothetical protein
MGKYFDIHEIKSKMNRKSFEDFDTTKNHLIKIFSDLKKLNNYSDTSKENYNLLEIGNDQFLSLLKITDSDKVEVKVDKIENIIEKKYFYNDVKNDVTIGLTGENEVYFFQFGLVDKDDLNILKDGIPIKVFDYEQEKSDFNLPVYMTSCALYFDNTFNKIYLVREKKFNFAISCSEIILYLSKKSKYGNELLMEKNIALKLISKKDDLNSSISDILKLVEFEVSVKANYLEKFILKNPNEKSFLSTLFALKGLNENSKNYKISQSFNVNSESFNKNLITLKEYYDLFFLDSENDLTKSLNLFKVMFYDDSGNYTVRVLNKEKILIAEFGSKRQELFKKEIVKLNDSYNYFLSHKIHAK